MGDFFSIVIPTMWVSDKIYNLIKKYEESDYVKEIILIDNNPSKKIDLSEFKKIIYYTENKNLYVNPSWNIGYSLSNYKLILSNDDIEISNLDAIFEMLIKTDYDIVGVNLNSTNNDMFIFDVEYFPENSYGCFMYIKNYTYIPEQIKIWFGDTILFDNSKKRGLLYNSGIKSMPSQTVSFINKSEGNSIVTDDRKFYNQLNNKESEFNVVIRTSGRVNFFKNAVESVKKYYPSAKLHITLDDEKDLWYVKLFAKDFDYSYYLINKKTIEGICKKIKLNRRPFVYNYYFNVVKPFLHNWVLYLDDDDELIKTPNFDKNDTTKVHIYKADITTKIVPSIQNFGKRPVLNDISTLCVLVHSSNLVDWIPNRGGDFDFISELYDKNDVIWHDEINSRCQMGGNFGKRNDINFAKTTRMDGFYLNLKKREDRREKMEVELKKTKHIIKRYEAVDGTTLTDLEGFRGSIKGSELKQYATYLSHLNMLKMARDNKWQYVMILEDDLTMCEDFDERLIIYLSTIPQDWKIAYLGFNKTPTTQLTKITDWIFRLNDAYGCFGMIIKGDFLDELITIVENKKVAIDEVIRAEIQPKYGCYAFIPFFIYVNEDFSDLWNKTRTLTRISDYFEPILPKKEIVPKINTNINTQDILNKLSVPTVNSQVIYISKSEEKKDETPIVNPSNKEKITADGISIDIRNNVLKLLGNSNISAKDSNRNDIITQQRKSILEPQVIHKKEKPTKPIEKNNYNIGKSSGFNF